MTFPINDPMDSNKRLIKGMKKTELANLAVSLLTEIDSMKAAAVAAEEGYVIDTAVEVVERASGNNVTLSGTLFCREGRYFVSITWSGGVILGSLPHLMETDSHLGWGKEGKRLMDRLAELAKEDSLEPTVR